jgi:hypothetical protein
MTMTSPQPSCSLSEITVGRFAKVKALYPLTSTHAPSPVQIIEYSGNRAMLRMGRYMAPGTVVQLHMDGEFLLWKVFCCIASVSSYHVGIELAEGFENR